MPTARGKRTRIAEGVYADVLGMSAQVTVGSGPSKLQREKRFPRGTAMKEIRDWQTNQRALLTRKRGKPKRRSKDSFAVDVTSYLTTVESRPSYGSAKACLGAWVSVFGDRRRSTLTLIELQATMDGWHRNDDNPEGRYSGSMLNHCKDHLVRLYRALDQCEDADNVATKLRRYEQADLQPRAIDDAIVDEVLAIMPPSRTRACLKIMAYVGMPPARQRRLKPADLNLAAKTVYLVRRRKGGGTEEKTFPLTEKGVEALTEFVQLNAWGGVTKESLYTCFLRGVSAVNRKRARLEQPLIAPVRPYDLRHTFGTRVYRETGDLGIAAELLDVTLQTAKRYTLTAVPDRLAKAVATLNEGTPPPSPTVKPATQPRIRLVARTGPS